MPRLRKSPEEVSESRRQAALTRWKKLSQLQRSKATDPARAAKREKKTLPAERSQRRTTR